MYTCLKYSFMFIYLLFHLLQIIKNNNYLQNIYKIYLIGLCRAQHTRVKKLQLNLQLRMIKSLLVNNKHTNLNIKLLMHKSLIKPIWT